MRLSEPSFSTDQRRALDAFAIRVLSVLSGTLALSWGRPGDRRRGRSGRRIPSRGILLSWATNHQNFRVSRWRSHELALLRDGFAAAQGGQGQAVFVYGEAGIGKSRLLLEFRRDAEHITPRSAYCRYLLRPAVAQDRLRLLDDGRVMLTLKSAWADGTRAPVRAAGTA